MNSRGEIFSEWRFTDELMMLRLTKQIGNYKEITKELIMKTTLRCSKTTIHFVTMAVIVLFTTVPIMGQSVDDSEPKEKKENQKELSLAQALP